MKAILTGGTGFIGRYVVAELLKSGANVTVLTSSPSSMPFHNSSVKTITAGYQFKELAQRLSGKTYDIFYHLGWAGVSGKEKNNIPLQLSNIETSLDMLRLSKSLKCKLFLAAGTVAEYVYNECVIDFSRKQTPIDIYGATKTSVHYLLEAVAAQLGQDMIWTVLPSTYGEGRTEDNILTYTITTLLDGKYPVYGNLQSNWDFVYVSDVAKAIIKIGEKGRHNITYGIGSGTHKTLREYVLTIRDMINPSLPLGIGEKTPPPERKISSPGIMPSSCINIEPLTRDTGWKPEIPFEEGIQKTIQYYETKRKR